MLTPQKLEKIPIELQKIFSKLEQDIMIDIVRRVAENGEITRTADYQINRLHELGVSKKIIKKYIQEALALSEKEIDNIYENAIKASYTEDKFLYKATGTEFIEFNDNDELQQTIRAIKKQTKEQIYNLSNSTGFIKSDNGKRVFTPLTQYYQDILDKNVSGILNGVIDYNTAIKNTVQEMTKSGLRTVDYASGKSFRIESAVRTALMTGVNQIAAKISNENAEKLGTEYFEVSAHGTARPSHQVWQGRVYKKEELESVCGLGKVDGLCGANCRHSYYPFIPGISVRKYTDEQLEEWANRENTPKKYGDKEYTSYEASQEQRKLEMLMRKQRQDIKLLKEGGANEEDIMIAETRYRITSDEYVKFSKAMGLPQQRERVYSGETSNNLTGNLNNEAPKFKEKYLHKAYNSYKKNEILQMANEVKIVASKYTNNESKWKGEINISSRNVSAKLWNCRIETPKMTAPHILLHEILHSHSISYFDVKVYSDFKKIEEASVELFAKEISKKEQINIIESEYDDMVNNLIKINDKIQICSDTFDFAKELFNIPVKERLDFLEDRIYNYVIKNNSISDAIELRKLVDTLYVK